MKLVTPGLIILVLICITGCRQSQRNFNSIELGFENDTTGKAECFADFYRSKLKYPNPDSLVNRFTFPFTYVEMVNATDWQTVKFTNLKELTSSNKFNSLVTLLHQQIKFDSRFHTIFAPETGPERSLKVSAINKAGRFIYVHFVTNSGQWLIRSLQEVPVFEDGGIPVEND